MLAPLAWIADIIAPARCAACDAFGATFCEGCALATCAGAPLTRAAQAGAPSIIALGPFTGTLARAIRSMKFGGRRDAAGTLGALLAESIGFATDVIVPVPLHPSRLRERGFNQAEIIGQAIALTRNVKMETKAIQRVTPTSPQSRLPLPERRANVSDAFSPGPRSASVRGRRVLLVDDVVTTGSTLGACAVVLRSCGATSVNGAALAIRL